jgi:hypothetical protein
MTKLNAEAARWDSLRVNFTVIMWALLFFVPLPIPGLGLQPDVLAWGLLLIGVGATARHVAGLGGLFATAAAGMALWVVRALVGMPEEGTSLVAAGLFAGMWALVTAFAVQLSSLVRRLALELGADDVAHSVAWRGWLPLVLLVMFGAVPFVPERSRFLLVFAALAAWACTFPLLMGVPAGAARMFAHSAKQAMEKGGDEADS